MADISLKINAESLQAEKDFQSFAAMSEKTKKAIEEFQKSFDPKQIDDFISKNKLAALGIEQTQGPLKALTAETKGYEKEIRKLISSGLSPQSAEIQKLQAEYVAAGGKLDVLTAETKRHNAELKKHNEGFSNGIKSIVAYAAAYISLSAVVGTIKSLTNGLAEQGEETGRNARKIGITTESYQTLQYAANLADISTEEFSGGMEKLTKNLGAAKDGTGTLSSFLKKANPDLLAQMKAASSSEEALKLLANETALLSNAEDKAALATAAFGKSGMGMIPILEGGAASISKAQAEAKKYGFVMSDEAVKASEEFSDSQKNLGFAVKGLIVQIGTPLLKPLSDAMVGFTNWATEDNNLIDTLKALGYVLSGVAAGLTAFMVITKGAAAVQMLTTVFQGLTAAIAANPIGAIAVVITAVLIPAIIWMVKNWDLVKYKVVDFALAAREKMLEVGMVIREKVMGSIIALMDKMSQLSGVGQAFKMIADSERGITEAMKVNIKTIGIEREINKLSYEQSEKERLSRMQGAEEETAAIEEANARKGKSYFQYAENMKAALELITMTETQKRNQDLEAAITFFEQRAELESEDFEKRMEFLTMQQEAILAIDGITSEQRLLMLNAVTKASEKENKKQMQARAIYGQQLLSTTSNMLTDLQAVFANFGKQSRTLAIAAKAIAVASAIINTFLAVTKALSSGPPPYSFVMAAITAAAGLAAVAKIVTTPIPSGETGLSYTVPDIPQNRNDKAAVHASAGEGVTVTPRGESTGKDTIINIDVGEDNLFSFIQRGIDTGKINLSNKNVGRQGVFA